MSTNDWKSTRINKSNYSIEQITKTGYEDTFGVVKAKVDSTGRIISAVEWEVIRYDEDASTSSAHLAKGITKSWLRAKSDCIEALTRILKVDA